MKYPFKFLDAYGKDDFDIFFGRMEDIEALYKMLFETNMVWLYGASGTGKTSLIQCGLANKFNTYDWYDIRIKRGSNLVASYKKALAEAGGNESADDDNEIDELENLLQHLDLKKVTTGSKTIIPETKPVVTETAVSIRNIYQKHFRPIYLIFDQFEELFILGTDEEQEEFLEILLDLQHIEQPVKMIFSIREEYLFHLSKYEKAISHLLHKKLRLEAMDLKKIKEVMHSIDDNKDLNVKIAGQTREAKDKVIEEIFNKVRDNELQRTIQLPYLQVFLDKLYMRVTNDPKKEKLAEFSIMSVQAMGDIGSVLPEFLVEEVVKINQDLQKAFGVKSIQEKGIWSVLSPFVTVDKTKSPISRSVVHERVRTLKKEIIDSIIDQLVARKILRYSPDTLLHELAHDSLCETIASRRNQDERNLLNAKRMISNQLMLFKGTGELISNNVMSFIEPYVIELMEQKQLTDPETELLDASRQKIRDELEEKEIKRKKELQTAIDNAERNDFLRRRSYKFARAAAVLAIVAFVAAVIAYGYYKSAKNEAGKAQEATGAAVISLKKLDSTYAELKKTQILSDAKEIEKFGDSYRDNGDLDAACENYRRAIDSLKEYKTDTVYRRLSDKLKRCK